MLTDQQSKTVRSTIAATLQTDVRRVVDDAKIFIDLNADEAKFESLKAGIEQSLGVDLREVHQAVLSRVEEIEFQLTKPSMQAIAEYLGPWPKFPKRRVSWFVLLTVSMLEAIVAKALELGHLKTQASPASAGAPASPSTIAPDKRDAQSAEARSLDQTLDEPIAGWVETGPHVAGWSEEDRSWWSNLPQRIGGARFRLLLVGMLRTTFVEVGGLDDKVEACLNAAERFAETNANWDQREARLRGVKSWKLGRNTLWRGLIPILEADLSPMSAGPLVGAIALTRRWEPARVSEEIRSYCRSIDDDGAAARLDEAWRTKTVSSLCKEMHRSRDFSRMPELGELLRAAGCADPEILAHCEDPTRKHIRGDWLVVRFI